MKNHAGQIIQILLLFWFYNDSYVGDENYYGI